jgi:hypothetical protein
MNMFGARQTRSARANLYEKTHQNALFLTQKHQTTQFDKISSNFAKTTRFSMVCELREACFADFVAMILVVLATVAPAHGRF